MSRTKQQVFGILLCLGSVVSSVACEDSPVAPSSDFGAAAPGQTAPVLAPAVTPTPGPAGGGSPTSTDKVRVPDPPRDTHY